MYMRCANSRSPKHQQSNLLAIADPDWTLSTADMATIADLASHPFHTIGGADLSGEKRE